MLSFNNIEFIVFMVAAILVHGEMGEESSRHASHEVNTVWSYKGVWNIFVAITDECHNIYLCIKHCEWLASRQIIPDNKVHGANMGPIWDRQDAGGPHVGPMNFAIWDVADYI